MSEDFKRWWLSSKYMQVVYSGPNARQIACDGWEARQLEIDALREALGHEQQGNFRLERDNCDLRNEIDALKEELAIRINSESRAWSRIDALKTEVTDLTNQVEDLIKTMDEKEEEFNMDWKELKAENERLRDAVGVVDATLRASGQYLMANALCAATMAAPDTKGE